MGMFDTVYVQVPLPLALDLPESVALEFSADVQANGLQTKDMECLLDVYTITSNGKLTRHIREWGSHESRRPAELVDYHGRLKCHTMFTSKVHPDLSFYINYTFKFTDGILSKVEDAQAVVLGNVTKISLKDEMTRLDSDPIDALETKKLREFMDEM